MKKKKETKAVIIIPANLKVESHEILVAELLAKYFNKTVKVLEPRNGYKQKTPDFRIENEYYELKTPKGKSARTIQQTLRTATKQAKNIIISSYKFPYNEITLLNRLQHELKYNKNIKTLLLLTKNNEIINLNS